MVVLHHPKARIRMAVPEGGRRPHDHGTGRTCRGDGCETRLNHYNSTGFCSLCEPARRNDVTEKKSAQGVDRARVLALLRAVEGTTISRDEMAEGLDLSRRSVAQHVGRLRDKYAIEIREVGGVPHYMYCIFKESPDAAPGPPAAPAPWPDRERTTDPAAAGAPLVEPPPAVSFDCQPTTIIPADVAPLPWPFETAATELSILRDLERLDDRGRARTLAYANHRWGDETTTDEGDET